MNRGEIIKRLRELDLIDFRDCDDAEHVVAFVRPIMRLAQDLVEEEREACARVCEAHTVDDVLAGVGIAKSCAEVIRARGRI